MLLFSFCSCATILLLTLVILRNISKLTQKKNLTSAIFVVIALLGSLHWTTIVIFILERGHINVILRVVTRHLEILSSLNSTSAIMLMAMPMSVTSVDGNSKCGMPTDIIDDITQLNSDGHVNIVAKNLEPA